MEEMEETGGNRICSREEPCMERPSSSTNYDDLLECAVCNEILHNPRTLTCEHSFCKECIDNMTLFKENQITLTCPLCEEEQYIESGLCNMKPSLLLKQMLDRTIRSKVTCKCKNEDCVRRASLYCVESGYYICEKCVGNFLGLATSLTFIPVKRSYWHNGMFPHCRQHDAFQEFYCLSCAELCCKYCKHETHGKHATMLLIRYNRAKYKENVIKEMEKLDRSKLELEVLQKDIETRSARVSSAEAKFVRSLAQRKNILVAKCLHMISDIEKIYRENYRKMEANYNEELSKRFVAYQVGIDRCKDIFDQEKKFNEGSALEKYCNLNQLLANIKECNESLEKVDRNLECSMNLDQVDDKDDELLFHSLNESFKVILKLPETMSESRDDLCIPFTYELNRSFQDIMKNDNEVSLSIRRMLEMELNNLRPVDQGQQIQHVKPNIEKTESMPHPLQQEFVSGSHFALAEQPIIQLIQRNQEKIHANILAYPKTDEDITDMQDFDERDDRFFATIVNEENLNTGANENFTDQILQKGNTSGASILRIESLDNESLQDHKARVNSATDIAGKSSDEEDSDNVLIALNEESWKQQTNESWQSRMREWINKCSRSILKAQFGPHQAKCDEISNEVRKEENICLHSFQHQTF